MNPRRRINTENRAKRRKTKNAIRPWGPESSSGWDSSTQRNYQATTHKPTLTDHIRFEDLAELEVTAQNYYSTTMNNDRALVRCWMGKTQSENPSTYVKMDAGGWGILRQSDPRRLEHECGRQKILIKNRFRNRKRIWMTMRTMTSLRREPHNFPYRRQGYSGIWRSRRSTGTSLSTPSSPHSSGSNGSASGK